MPVPDTLWFRSFSIQTLDACCIKCLKKIFFPLVFNNNAALLEWQVPGRGRGLQTLPHSQNSQHPLPLNASEWSVTRLPLFPESARSVLPWQLGSICDVPFFPPLYLLCCHSDAADVYDRKRSRRGACPVCLCFGNLLICFMLGSLTFGSLKLALVSQRQKLPMSPASQRVIWWNKTIDAIKLCITMRHTWSFFPRFPPLCLCWHLVEILEQRVERTRANSRWSEPRNTTRTRPIGREFFNFMSKEAPFFMQQRHCSLIKKALKYTKLSSDII